MDWYLGADPEFVLWLPKMGRIRRPHDVVQDPMGPNHERFAAIGVDGDRPTASMELRPGMSPSAEELINRMADLLGMLKAHYKPAGVAYRAGAYVDPEPLGGHTHFGWDGKQGAKWESPHNDMLWKLAELVSAWQIQADYLMPMCWEEAEVIARANWARANRRDFGKRFDIRPEGGWDAVMRDNHFEFRYLPSYLNTPELAYVVMGGQELLAREVMGSPVGKRNDWGVYIKRMYNDNNMAPPGGPSLAKALTVALKHKSVPDFSVNW